MNCIIIDDDEMSRRVIERYIDKTDFLELLDSYPNAIAAINKFTQDEEVDLVFLDIEMPEMSGYDFLNTLNYPCQVIIISSKEKYALEAFEYNVTDYLLKPILYSRFFRAVEKAQRRYEENREIKEGINAIFIKQENRLIRVRYDEVLWIEALENYVMVTTYSEKYTIHFTMKAIEGRLPLDIFLRVHRSYIVNKNKIREIRENSLGIDIEGDSIQIPIGKSYRDRLMGDINLMIR